MAKQPTTPKSLQSRNQAPPVGESGIGFDPSSRPNASTDEKTPQEEGERETDHSELSEDEIAALEAAKINAPDGDDDIDPDAEVAEGVEEEAPESEEVLVRLLHPEGVHHINNHPLEQGTVVSMTREEFEGHQTRGMQAEIVNQDDFDGEVYDTSEPWKPEQKDKHGNVIDESADNFEGA